jgi:hypothetical protein
MNRTINQKSQNENSDSSVTTSTTTDYSTRYETKRIHNNKLESDLADYIQKTSKAGLIKVVSFDNQTSIKPVETERYMISEKDGGYLRIVDKQTNEGFNWKLNENQIQVDEESGLKFLINDLGAGFFNMVVVDNDLEKGLKDALGVDELPEKELEDFTVHQDSKTGIYYITSDGYESQGGQLILDDTAKEKLDVLADEYMKEYPSLLKSKEEAWFYATFEVRGIAKRTTNGIMMISPNSISFKDKYGENDWTMIFEPKYWSIYKKYYDDGIENMEKESSWKNLNVK